MCVYMYIHPHRPSSIDQVQTRHDHHCLLLLYTIHMDIRLHYNMHLHVVGTLAFAAAQLVERPDALLEPLLARDPEVLAALHDICEHRAAQEDHVLPAGRVFDLDLEFL
jgi:hypothetical protein